MPKSIAQEVTSSLEEMINFTVGEPDGTTSAKYESVVLKLTEGMTADFQVGGDAGFDRGVGQAAKFQAALIEMQGLIENIEAQGNPASHLDQITMLKNQIKSARLGIPISDTNGLSMGAGIATGSVSVGNSRANSGAIAEYNASLSSANADITRDAASFSAKYANTRIKISAREKGRIIKTLYLPLTERTLQGLYKRRVGAAVVAGQGYVK